MFKIKSYLHLFGILLIFLVTFPICAEFSQRTSTDGIKYNAVKTWAEKLGLELWHLGDFITRRKEVQESYETAQVVSRVGSKIVENMANEIKMMMELKISAIKRIMDTAENTALAHQNEPVNQNHSYYNAKEMLEPGEAEPTEPPIPDTDDCGVPKIKVPPKRIVLIPKTEFFNIPVNVSVSSVQVPTNVFDRASEVIHSIQWSENLDQTFRDNFKKDPTLSWQFFGSATGFLRQFPASKWGQDPVDLYDCRLRSWFIEAATSPKDMIILMDGSGSMTGQRLDVAKAVVRTILDTLGTNDFVNVYTFGEHVKPVVPCFQDVLAQATLGNIREFKKGIDQVKTEQMANFTAALIKAFDILELYRTESFGARCNQAIMIVSDGAPFSYSDIFEQYNWQNLPYKPVRVFTYLIGKEVADVKEIKSMACDNQGYYVHLTDSAAVREKVLNYIPVMARPLVLGKHEHPIIWTEVYADYVDQQMTDWLWCVKQDEEQRQDVINFRERGENYFLKEEEDKRYFAKLRKNEELFTESDKYQFMTTVAMPVYDRRENANITEDVLINEAYWESQTRETRIASILGVAGTDIPIRDIKKLILPFMLGPHGYGFIVTNNGFVLLHPDFRPIFQGDILKPSYNSVDMIELELLDDDRDPRDFNPILLGIRDSIINQSTGSKWLLIKQHYDDMKRVTRMKRQYYWAPITNTPFTLVITYPDAYGNERIQYRIEEEIHRLYLKGINVSSFFSGNWKIHPDWLYCKDSNLTFVSPESELLYFLNKMSRPGWKWPLSRTSLPPEHTAAMYSNVNTSSGRTSSSSSSNKESSYSYSSYYCDRYLVQSLAFDARVTEWFSKNTSFNSKDDKGNEFKQRFGITVTFLATHSGLTRWQEFYSNVTDEMRHLPDFHEKNRRSIDEIWYKRAVEQYFIESQSFVFSVPHNSGENPNETLVTASHAIFHTEGGKSAPAAVVGFQFQHSALYALFKNITSYCADCTTTCSSDGINCFILDNNGYVIISPNLADIGNFFGEVNGQLMLRLIQDKVYKEVIIYDYQAICFEENGEESGSGFLYSPILKILKYMKYIFKTILWYIVRLQLVSSEPAMDHYFDDNMTDYGANNKEWLLRVTLRRTRLMGCDTRRRLYTLYSEKNNAAYEIPASGCERPYVVYPIPASNLIMLVADMLCPQEPSIKIYTYPVEVNYNYGENSSFACYKSQNPELPRVRPTSCINKHMNESSIELCGDGNNLLINHILILMPIIIYNFL